MDQTQEYIGDIFITRREVRKIFVVILAAHVVYDFLVEPTIVGFMRSWDKKRKDEK